MTSYNTLHSWCICEALKTVSAPTIFTTINSFIFWDLILRSNITHLSTAPLATVSTPVIRFFSHLLSSVRSAVLSVLFSSTWHLVACDSADNASRALVWAVTDVLADAHITLSNCSRTRITVTVLCGNGYNQWEKRMIK